MFKTGNLYQNDATWKATPLGNQASETIGSWGCLLTSMTMVLNAAGYSETPATVNEKMKANGGFQGALVLPAVLPILFPNLVYRGFVACEDNPAPMAQIDAALEAGKPVIVQVDWNPQAGVQTHWVVLKEKKGSDYSVYDPFQYKGDTSDKELLLTSRYKYQGTDASHAISGVVWYEIKNAAPPPAVPKAPVPAEKYTVYVAEDDLALRSEPSANGYLLKRMTAGTPLVSLEARSAAESKIGQANQWLFAQEPASNQGYTAAWYLSKTLQPPAAPAPAAQPSKPAAPATPAAPVPASSAGSLTLTALDELALRSRPEVAADSLIRTLHTGEMMTASEPAAQAAAKIGVVGQWIKVRVAGNQEGYVAAWYVARAGSTPPAAPAASAGPLKVKATTEGVALRSQPVISDATLIKRVPNGTLFDVTESGAATKVGVTGQWLKVKDPQGTEGFVAAWYVALPGSRALEPREAAPAIPLEEKLKSISDQFAGVELTKETPKELLNQVLSQFPPSGEVKG